MRGWRIRREMGKKENKRCSVCKRNNKNRVKDLNKMRAKKSIRIRDKSKVLKGTQNKSPNNKSSTSTKSSK